MTAQATHYRYWTPVIPNSQLVAIPYPPDKPDQYTFHISLSLILSILFSPFHSSHLCRWILEAYIAPSGITVWVIVAVAVALAVNFALILFFRWKEKVLKWPSHFFFFTLPDGNVQREDEREKRAKAHLFSFDAL
jgi:hypothetical protein